MQMLKNQQQQQQQQQQKNSTKKQKTKTKRNLNGYLNEKNVKIKLEKNRPTYHHLHNLE